MHLSGSAGTGKSLLASIIAALFSRSGAVVWIATDGKSGFIKHLKCNLEHYGGVSSNISVTRVMGYTAILEVIHSIDEHMSENTCLVVIDSITRVLDMSRNDPLLWGRVLFEEVLPILASVSETRKIPILLTSEVRDTEGTSKAVYHSKFKQWAHMDLVLERPHGLSYSKILQCEGSDCSYEEVGRLELNPEGWASLSFNPISLEV